MSSPPIMSPFAIFCSMLGVWTGHLFADTNGDGPGISPWWVAPLAPLLMALGGAIQWAVGERRKAKEAREKKETEERATYTAQLEKLVERQKQDNGDLVKEKKDGETECESIKLKYHESRVNMARKDGYIRYLESLLKANKVPFEVWDGKGGPNGNGGPKAETSPPAPGAALKAEEPQP